MEVVHEPAGALARLCPGEPGPAAGSGTAEPAADLVRRGIQPSGLELFHFCARAGRTERGDWPDRCFYALGAADLFGHCRAFGPGHRTVSGGATTPVQPCQSGAAVGPRWPG